MTTVKWKECSLFVVLCMLRVACVTNMCDKLLLMHVTFHFSQTKTKNYVKNIIDQQKFQSKNFITTYIIVVVRVLSAIRVYFRNQ